MYRWPSGWRPPVKSLRTAIEAIMGDTHGHDEFLHRALHGESSRSLEDRRLSWTINAPRHDETVFGFSNR